MSIITLTTDFGLADGYVGTMKGVILGIAPTAIVVDISHDILPPSPQDWGARGVREAAYTLYAAYPYFPQGTIHVVVVDPGVGSERRAIALRTPQATFVAPDNGVLSYVVAGEKVEEIVDLTNPRYHLSPVSRTFHGRDIFAPAAAHLARGIPLAELGQPLAEIIVFPLPRPQARPDGAIVGQVIHVDRFGNLITSIMSKDLADHFLLREGIIEVKGQSIRGIANNYAEGTPGELLALIGSSDHLEIAMSSGSASQILEAKVGDEVLLKVEGHEDR
ncbi:MAG: SAM-dependent chlorinase/fluorinase [Anaerolineales bacterium]|nr:SAM-dependent chlorinase/fluorinase [Anaerolineales bacterium]